MQFPAELTTAIQNQEVILFIGGGASTSSGLPDWPTLMRPWANAVGARWPQNVDDLTASHLLTVAQFYENQLGRNALIRALREALDTTTVAPSALHQILPTLPISTIFTTNYDDLLERSWQATNRKLNVIVSEAELAFWREDQVQLIKLFGDLDRPQSLVITQSDFNTYLATHPRLIERLRTLLESKTVLFLGYSLQDPFFNQIWDQIGLSFGNLRRRGFALLSHADPLTVDDFQRRGVHILPFTDTAKNQIALMSAWLTELVTYTTPATPRIPPSEGKQPDIDAYTPIAAETVKILFLAANPRDTVSLRIDAEIRAIRQALRKANFRDRFALEAHGATQLQDLEELLLQYQPHIVHFSGHGTSAHEILFEDEAGNSHPASPRSLSRLFAILKDNIQCVVLNACYSETQAKAIAEQIDCVVGMTTTIEDETSLRFSTAFYQALAYGRTVQTAFDLALNRIDRESLSAQDTPQLIDLRHCASKMLFVAP
jgi:hypothetical protein